MVKALFIKFSYTYHKKNRSDSGTYVAEVDKTTIININTHNISLESVLDMLRLSIDKERQSELTTIPFSIHEITPLN